MNDTPAVRCLFITSIFPPINGGSAVVYENLCRYATQGSAFVLTSKRDYASGKKIENWQEVDEKFPFPVFRIDLLRPLVLQSQSRLHSLWMLIANDIPQKIKILYQTAQIIRTNNVNVVCIGELISGSWLGLMSRLFFGCKVINYIHGEEVTTTTTYLLYGKNRKFYLNQADAIVSVSQFTRQALIDIMNTDPNKIHIIENGVDIHKFFPGNKDNDILQKHKISNKKIIFTVGRLVQRKGIDKTLYALPEIIKSIPNIHYLIGGTGEFRSQLDAIVEELGLHDYVTFTGRIADEDLVKYYQSCDLFLMPNRELADHDTEGFGLVFLEANACEKAVIGGRAGGAVEAVKDNETGILVDGYQKEEIANAVIELLNNDKQRLAMQQEGLKTAQAASWESKSSRFFGLCKNLL